MSLISPADFERETGQSNDLLRKWRERYGFPRLHREHGEVGYTREQVRQMRLILQLQKSGFRPSRIVGKSWDELESLRDLIAPEPHLAQALPVVEEAVGLLERNQMKQFEELVSRESITRTVPDFVTNIAAALTVATGRAWEAGSVSIYQEHLFSNFLGSLLNRIALDKKPRDGYPKILFATLSGEHHALGLLMAHAILADQGAECIYFGSNVPSGELVSAANALRPDILALSFSLAYPQGRVLPDIKYLRSRLPESIEIWAGGSRVSSIRRKYEGVRLFTDLESSIEALHGFRAMMDGSAIRQSP